MFLKIFYLCPHFQSKWNRKKIQFPLILAFEYKTKRNTKWVTPFCLFLALNRTKRNTERKPIFHFCSFQFSIDFLFLFFSFSFLLGWIGPKGMGKKIYFPFNLPSEITFHSFFSFLFFLLFSPHHLSSFYVLCHHITFCCDLACFLFHFLFCSYKFLLL